MLRYIALVGIAFAAIPLLPFRAETGPKLATLPPPLIEPALEVSRDPAALALHRRFLKEFIEHQGFGRMRMVKYVASVPVELDIANEPHHLLTRRLIGAWREGGARLYEAHEDLKMQRIHRARAGALDAVDAAALTMLKRGEEVVIDRAHARLLGAIRAQQSCLECHEVERGTLLGALRYDFAKTRVARR